MAMAKAPRIFVFRGSITRPLTWLSTLRRVGRPTATQDSLLAAGPALPGGIRTRRVSTKGFRVSSLFLLPKAFLTQAGWPRGIAPRGLPRIRTCPFRHTAPHIMSSLRGGTLSGSQPVGGADTVPASGRIDPREWSPYGDAARAISSRCRSQTIGIGTEQ